MSSPSVTTMSRKLRPQGFKKLRPRGGRRWGKRRSPQFLKLRFEILEDRRLLANWSGNITTDTTWANTEVQRITGTVTVESGATLTILPGTVVKFNTGTSLVIKGALNADGTATQGIVFTALADDTGLDGVLGTADDQDTNGGGPSSGATGAWNAIEFQAAPVSSLLDSVQIRFGGDASYGTPAAVVVRRTALTISNSLIRDSEAAGLRVLSSDPILSTNTYSNNAGAAISMDLASQPEIYGVTATNNGVNGLAVDTGTLTGQRQWNDPDIVYYLPGDVTVGEGARLTLGAGQNVAAGVGTDLIVDGTLVAAGTEQQPIALTSARDGALPVNLDNSATAAARGDWNGVTFTSKSSGNRFDYTEVRYGGDLSYSRTAAVYLNGGPLTWVHGAVRESEAAGLRLVGSNPTLTDLLYQNNTEAAVRMDVDSEPAIAGVTLENNGVNGLAVDTGTLTGERQWNDPDIVYFLAGDVTVGEGACLTLAAGQDVAAAVGIDLTVDGTLIAAGTEQQPILFTSDRDSTLPVNVDNAATAAGRGDWNGLTFNAKSVGSRFDYVDVRYAGDRSYGRTAAVNLNGGPLTWVHGAVRESEAAGLRLVGSSPTLTDLLYQNNIEAAVRMDVDSEPAITGVTLENNGVNGLAVDTGTLTGERQWNDPDIVYVLSGDVTVAEGARLTLAAGQYVTATVGADLLVDGTLLAPGTVSQPIVFTSNRDGTLPVNVDNAPETAVRGDWNGLTFRATSTGNRFDYVDVRYAGDLSYGRTAAVNVNGAALTWAHGGVHESEAAGLHLAGSSPTLTNLMYRNNTGAAVRSDVASEAVISGVTVLNNGVNGLAVDGGILTGERRWDDPEIVYFLVGDVTVAGGARLTLDAGQNVAAAAGTDLLIDGTLVATGSHTRPVVFTSNRDSALPANVDNAAPAAGRGDWNGLTFAASSRGSRLDYVEVRYAGDLSYSRSGAIYVNGGELSLSNSVVRDSESAGLAVAGNSPAVRRTTFQDNAGAAVRMHPATNPTLEDLTLTGNVANGVQVDGGALTTNAAWSATGMHYRLSGDVTVPAGVTLTLGAGVVLDGTDSRSILGSGEIQNAGMLQKTTGSGTFTVQPPVLNTGTVRAASGTLRLAGGVANNRPGVLSGVLGATLAVGRDLGGDTQNVTGFQTLHTLAFNGAGTAAAPQLLEALSRDLGSISAGFEQNFTLYSLSLSNGTYVRLVDQSDNAAGSGAEAVYVEHLAVPAGTTLDLAGLHLFTRSKRIAGTVTGGSVEELPDGGPLVQGRATPGRISVSEERDTWTLFGRVGQTVTVTVSTGATGLTPPLAPSLNFAQVTLLAPGGAVLATASSPAAGADVTLAGITLPNDGTYQIQIQSPTGQPTSTGNYVLAAWDATVQVTPLVLNQTHRGNIDTPFDVERWTFSGAAGQVLNFRLLGAENATVQFDLTGPNGVTVFANQTASIPSITLPAAGSYAVTVHTLPRETGAYAFRLESVSVTALTLGQPWDGPLTGSAASQLFQVSVPQVQQLRVTLTDTSATDRNELYLKFGSAPTRADYQYKFSTPASANQQVVVPSAASGAWYLLVYTEAAPQPGNLRLLAEGARVFLTAVTPDRAGNAAAATLTVTGSGFDHATTVSLVSAGNVVFAANRVQFDRPTQVTASFAAGSVPAGTYAVRVAQNGASATLPEAFTFVEGGQAKLEVNLIAPSALGYHIPAVLYVQYANRGDVAMPAPLLMLRPTQTHADKTTTAGAFLTLDESLVTRGFWTSALPDGFSHSLQFLGHGVTPGVLQPGESVEVPVYYAGWQKPWDFSYPRFDFNLKVVRADDATPIDWQAFQDSLPTPRTDPAAWNVIWSNLQAEMGNTWGSYITALDEDAAYLAQLGIRVNDVTDLWGFELAQAQGLTVLPQVAATVDAAVPAPGLALTFSRTFATSLSGRYELGPFGRGWSVSEGWWTTLAVDADGSVTISGVDGQQRRFQPDSRGGYLSRPGDTGKLLSGGGGAFTIRELDGQVTAFRADGKLAYLQDANNNRITAEYTEGRLTRLTHSAGQTLTLAYNSAGRITSVTDSQGHVTLYSYDAGHEHLLSVTMANQQTTSYTYSLGQGAATEHALTAVTNPDGTHQFLGYDGRGRLTNTHADGDRYRTTYSFGPAGKVVADGAGGVTTYFLDHRGLVVKLDDPLHRSAFFTFDANGNMTGVTDPAGQRSTYAYDAQGNLVAATDALGQTTRYAYDSRARVTSVTDPNGNVLRYAYDARGGLTATTYADGTVERAAYDPVGNLLNTTNRRGQVIAYTFNSSGQPLTKTYADGSHVDCVYDARGNLTSLTDATGTTMLSYDAQDRPTRIAYPGGRFLDYEYDSAGRRTTMVDQSGFTVRYAYDDLGRITGLTDGAGRSLVSYTYHPTGQWQEKRNGNGTSTTYDYDVAGQLTHLVNYDAAKSVTSRFDYTYDLLGQPTAVTTLEGSWSYTYDSVGQLTRAVFTSNNPSAVPHRDLQYNYDRAGNRISTVVNGATTAYATNALNQYVAVGSATYAYDADGNLILKTDDGLMTTYVYDAENNMLSRSAPGDTWTYQYDAQGNRVRATHNGRTVQYLNDPIGLGDTVAEYDGAGALLQHYVYGSGLVSRVESGGAAAYFDFDAIGNTVAVTGASGSVSGRYVYQPFGEALVTGGMLANAFQYGGEFGVTADGTDLYYMRARFYDPAIGRFVETDPIGLAGGSNLYRYADNSPIVAADPSGLSPGALVLTELNALVELAVQGGLGAQVNAIFRGSLYALQGGELGAGVDAGKLVRGLRGLLANNGIGIRGVVGGAAETMVAPAETLVAQGPKTGFRVLSRGLSSFGPGSGVASTVGQRVVMGAGVAGAFVGGFWFGRSVVRPALEHDQVFGIGKALEAYDDFMYKTFLGRVYDWFQGDPPGSTNAASRDPNEKVGPAGFGPAGFTTGDDVLSYRVSFENDAAATAPAQRVTITDRLSSQLAWDTLEFKEVAFGDVLLPVPAGSQYFATSMPLTLNDKVFTVEFELGLRSETGEVYATFASIDPHTELPPDVLTGFLPPEDGTGRGQGYFSYVIRAKPNLPTGTEIRNVALITFDDNPPIATNQVDPHDPSKGTDPTKEALNTIDAGIPSSQVTALPATSGPIFIVRWSGSDDTGGSDIAGYDVFVSDNGGAFTRWKSQTTETTAVFDGQVDHTYRFYTVAVDNVGHGEAVPATFDTQTLVLAVSNWQNPDIASDVDGDGEVLPMDVLTLINFINSRGGDTSLPSSPEQPPPYWNVNGDEAITALDVLTVINYINNPPAGQAEGEAPAESTSLAVPPPTLSSSVVPLAIWTGGVTVAPPPATEPANSVWRPLTASERARSRAHPWPAGPQGVWATELMDRPPLETEPWDEFASLLEETLADIAEQVADDWSGF